MDLIVETAAASRRTLRDCGLVIEALLDLVVCEAAEGRDDIQIRGLGTFYTKIRAPRPARNPRTGEVVPLPRRRVLLWRPHAELKFQVNQRRGHASH